MKEAIAAVLSGYGLISYQQFEQAPQFQPNLTAGCISEGSNLLSILYKQAYKKRILINPSVKKSLQTKYTFF